MKLEIQNSINKNQMMYKTYKTNKSIKVNTEISNKNKKNTNNIKLSLKKTYFK